MQHKLANKFSDIIAMAWDDRTTFDEIKAKHKISESEVINIMRKSLKNSSFKRWRARVSGRTTKHQKLFKAGRTELKKSICDFERT